MIASRNLFDNEATRHNTLKVPFIARNEQVVRSNRISSSKVKSPKSGFTPDFSGIFVCLRKCLSRGMWALIALISWKVLQKGGSRGGAKKGEKQVGRVLAEKAALFS
nr:MAG TPA: hypothetical protein [Caudoviricetes sp.]